ncbi:MAG: glycosyltransferase family 2 protein [Caulobacteraceae bacterium]
MSGSFPTAVIITAKNAAGTIGYAVRSALAQSCVTEVVVVDDGSSDGTGEVASACDDGGGRLKILRFDVNRGPSAGRNAAIEASSAPFLCVLDADDFMGEQRLERLFAQGGEDWDLLADDMYFASDYGPDSTFDRLLPDDERLPRELDLDAFGAGNLPHKTGHRRELGFLKPVIRRALLDRHAIRYDERLRLGEDLLFYAGCMLEGGRFRVVQACGYYAVQHPASLSAQHRTEDVEALHQALVEFLDEADVRGRPVGALRDFVRFTRNRLAFRRALDAKRERGLAGLARALAEHPASTPFIVREVARAKLGRLRSSVVRAPSAAR